MSDKLFRPRTGIAPGKPLTQLQRRLLGLPEEAEPSPQSGDDVAAEEIRFAPSAPFVQPIVEPTPPPAEESGQPKAKAAFIQTNDGDTKDVRVLPLQAPSGELLLSAPQQVEKLKWGYVSEGLKRRGVTHLGALSPEEQATLIGKSTTAAFRDIKGVIGQSERTGNLIVPVDEQRMLEDVGEGRTWAGWLTGQRQIEIASKIGEPLARTFGVPSPGRAIEGAYDRIMGPVNALAQPGFTASGVGTVEGENYAEREGKLSWISRLGLTTLFAPAMKDDIALTDWGSERYNKAIAEGADIISSENIDKIGGAAMSGLNIAKPILESLPGVNAGVVALDAVPDDMQRTVLGVGLTGAAIWFEPDVTLLLGPVGWLAGNVGRSVDLARTVLSRTSSASEAVARAVEAGEVSVSKVRDLYHVGTAEGRRLRAAVAELQGRLAEQGLASPAAWAAGTDWKTAVASLDSRLAMAQRKLRSTVAGAKARTSSAGQRARDAIDDLNVARAARKAVPDLQKEATEVVDDLSNLYEVNARLSRALDLALEVEPNAAATTAKEFMALLQRAEKTRQSLAKTQRGIEQAKAVIAAGADAAEVDKARRRLRSLLDLRAALIAKQSVNAGEGAVGLLAAELLKRTSDLEALTAKAAATFGIDPAKLVRAAEAKAKKWKRAEKAAAQVTKAAAKAQQAADQAALETVAGAHGAAVRAEDAARNVAASERARVARAEGRVSHAKGQIDLLASAPELLAGLLRDMARQDRLLSGAIRAGSSEAKIFDATRSVSASMGGRIDPAEWSARVAAKYGPEFAAAASRAAATATTPARMLRAEERIHNAAEMARVSDFGAGRAAIETIKQGQVTWRAGVAANIIKTKAVFSRIFEPLRYLAGAPEIVRATVKKAINRAGTFENDLDKVASASKSADEAVQNLWEYLSSDKKFEGANGNQLGGASHVTRAAEYLRLVATAGEDVFKQDVIARSLAKSPLPSGEADERVFGMALDRLYRAALDGSALDELGGIRGQVMALSGASDSAAGIMRVVSRSVVHASSMLSLVYDWRRATESLGLDAATASAMAFISNPNAIRVSEVSRTADGAFDRARGAAGALNMQSGLTMGNLVPKFAGGVETQNRLVQMADGAWMPETVYRAAQSIPFRLEKELRQFHREGTVIDMGASMLGAALQTWKAAAIGGYFLPRARLFTNALVGDFSQLASTVGLFPAAKIIGESLLNVPGTGAQVAVARLAGRFPVLAAFSTPDLARVVDGQGVVTVAEGTVSAKAFMKEAIEAGVNDSLAGDALKTVLAKDSQKTWFSRLGKLLQHGPFQQATLEMFDSLQQRTRLLTYLNLRKTMSSDVAAKAMNDALFDYRSGAGPLESYTVMKLSAFYLYRRNALRNLGAHLTEALTTPMTEYMPRALIGQTRLSRSVSQVQGVELAGEALDKFTWEDDTGLADNTDMAREIARNAAPWWSDGEQRIMNLVHEPSNERREWYRQLGISSPAESIILGGLTAADQVYILNHLLQMSAVSMVAAAEMVGVKTNVTTADAEEIAVQNIEMLSDTLVPVVDRFVSSGLMGMVGVEGKVSGRGAPVPQAQSLLLKRLGLSEAGPIKTDDRGRTRVENSISGAALRFILAEPRVSDLARSWAIFDNPSWQAGWDAWVAESLARWASPVQAYPVDPFYSIEKDAESKARRIKEMVHQNSPNRK